MFCLYSNWLINKLTSFYQKLISFDFQLIFISQLLSEIGSIKSFKMQVQIFQFDMSVLF